MKIAIAQLNPTIGNFAAISDTIQLFSEKAKADNCDLVVFPELSIMGYPPRDLLEKPDFISANKAWLETLVNKIQGIGVIVGVVTDSPAGLFNSAVLFENGRVIHTAHKRLLPNYDVFDEERYFIPGSETEVFNYKGATLGLTICEDVWNDVDYAPMPQYALDPVAEMKAKGADMIINISASPFYTGKQQLRQTMLSAVARKHGTWLIYANQTGGNDSVLFDGASCAFAPDGNLIAQAPAFEESMVLVDTEKNTGDMAALPSSDMEAIQKGLVCGTRDYVQKCGFQDVVIGLSGGIDSALVAAIAAEALGPENVLTIFMPSDYTSDDNYEDTRQLADNLGVELKTIPIRPMFETFMTIHPDLDEQNPGITEQNFQARIRGTILMGYSNQENRLVLTTGNKSEMAVGYCTLYGDMNGGLAVISDVYKTDAYLLSEHINKDSEIIPRRIIDKAPSAELKPDQTDQDDLPPYSELDDILKAMIEDFKSGEEIAEMGHAPETVADIIRRVTINEYKRQQAAPGLKITPKAFGYGRRYPIAQKYRSPVPLV